MKKKEHESTVEGSMFNNVYKLVEKKQQHLCPTFRVEYPPVQRFRKENN